MILTMKMVHVVTTVSQKKAMIRGLRDLGIMHLAEKKSADRETIERFTNLSRTAMALKDYLPKKGEIKPILSDDEFYALYESVQKAMEEKTQLIQEVSTVSTEIERIQAWGDFDPSELKALKNSGYDFHFYKMGKKEYEMLTQDDSVRMIRLAPVDKMDAAAVIGSLPQNFPATEFAVPEKSSAELKAQLELAQNKIEQCNQILSDAALHSKSFEAQMVKLQNDENFAAANATAQSDGDLVWISGYVPEEDLERFTDAAVQNKWAWAVEDVADDDDKIPTKVRYSKLSGLIKPVFDILGILPGYHEQDISTWFLMFFTLFFAMILGDAGYGSLILLGTIAFTVKSKKMTDATFLLYVVSIATIVWGAITGTWFGMEGAMHVPVLKALVIPSFANYPEYFNVTSAAQQNTIMKFSFSIGAIQMALGSLLSVKKKISEKNLSWVADAGWMVSVIAMYLLSLYLVIGEKLNVMLIFGIIAVGFVLVLLFGGMAPDKTFAQGLKSGLADAFTVFLNTISCFGNVMSYIRLFAVGMAGLAIAQSFNNLASGFKGPLVIVGVIIVLIGHALNLVMGFLSVVVHGVRLNVLEFSGQVGLEWTGIAYDAFKTNKKIKN